MHDESFIYCTSAGPRNVGYQIPLKNIDEIKDNIKVDIISNTYDKIEFTLERCDVSLANGLRRILLSHVPSMAIDTCHLYQNTGVIQDEILCHRIGLIPFKVDPDLFIFRASDHALNSQNSLQYHLQVVCPQDVEEFSVYSKHIVWAPRDEQELERFKHCRPEPCIDNILITRLGPGQEIDMTLYLEKGIGHTHAKWSPVCTAFYKLESTLRLKKFDNGEFAKLTQEELDQLQSDLTFDKDSGVALNLKNPVTYRLAVEKFPNKLEFLKRKDKYIFSVESIGSVSAESIVQSAFNVLLEKFLNLKKQNNGLKENKSNKLTTE